jgi:carbon-monoxide dehydrogenase small subunit
MKGQDMLVRLNVNGEWREANVWPGASLMSMLRDDLGLWGTKNGCEQGECGSCSVWLDGEVVCSCLVLAAQADGRRVATVESLAGEGELHPVQQAFLDAGAVQCGFCTPGLVVAVSDLLRRDPGPPEEVIREALSGNLCRCTGYQKILDAVRLAATRMERGTA